MEPRFNMLDNALGARFVKRFANTSLVIAQSSLPKSTQELVGLRQPDQRLRLVRRHPRQGGRGGRRNRAPAEPGRRLA
jgi:hypothetical protein